MSIADLQLAQQPLEIQNLAQQFKIIEQELIQKTPGLPDALVAIHKMLLEHEELVNILDDDDIAMLHKAHESYKQVALIQKEEKKINSGKRKKLTDGDLANL
jgi:hypothetical protein